eukprot:7305791-Ditylum_brightwellii.AAC.1
MQGYLILNGTALLLSKTTVPFAMLNEPKELHIYDANVCEHSLESTLVLMNSIKQDESQQHSLESTLVLMNNIKQDKSQQK